MNIATQYLIEAFEKSSKVNESKTKLVEDVENKYLTESDDNMKDSLHESDSLGDHGEEYGLLYLQLSQSIMDSLKDNVPSHITSPRILRGHVPGYNANYTSASLDGSEIFEKACNAFTHTAVDLLLDQYDE